MAFSTMKKRKPEDEPHAPPEMEDTAPAPALYMALELRNRSWRLAFGDGASVEGGQAAAAKQRAGHDNV